MLCNFVAHDPSVVNQYVHIRDGIIVADALAPIGTEHEE